MSPCNGVVIKPDNSQSFPLPFGFWDDFQADFNLTFDNGDEHLCPPPIAFWSPLIGMPFPVVF